LYAITGQKSARTMQLLAIMKGQPLLSLVDSGSTHNFISYTAAQHLGMQVQPGTSAKVSVANGKNDHLTHIGIVFELLCAHNLYVKRSKCSFGETQVAYLGHVVSEIGVVANTNMVQAIIDWPQPQFTTTLRGFLGLAGYYREFIRNYNHLAAPLTNMLKRNSFQWDETSLASFDTLKKALATAPVLQLPNFNDPFIIECDASGGGIGAVLQQNGHSIAFFSHWVDWLPWAEYCYNTSFHTALQTTPFKVVYGRDHPRLLSYVAGSSRVEAIDNALLDRDLVLLDIRHREVAYEPGSLVWLRLHPYRQKSVAGQLCHKLAPPFFGPFPVLRRIGKLRMSYSCPVTVSCIIFHVSLLKAFKGAAPTVPPSLPPLADGRVVPMPCSVLRACLNRGTWELLVHWCGFDLSDATWEDAEHFRNAYPDFKLEDK
ncbi:putative mitochondrial protein, partial [Nicotiana attenuata]